MKNGKGRGQKGEKGEGKRGKTKRREGGKELKCIMKEKVGRTDEIRGIKGEGEGKKGGKKREREKKREEGRVNCFQVRNKRKIKKRSISSGKTKS